MPSSECCAMAVRKSNGVRVPVICIPCVTHQSNTEFGVRCSGHERLGSLAVACFDNDINCCALPGAICFNVISRPEYVVGQRNDVFDPRLECGCPDREIAAAGS